MGDGIEFQRRNAKIKERLMRQIEGEMTPVKVIARAIAAGKWDEGLETKNADCLRFVESRWDDYSEEAEQALSALAAAGYAVVSVEQTETIIARAFAKVHEKGAQDNPFYTSEHADRDGRSSAQAVMIAISRSA